MIINQVNDLINIIENAQSNFIHGLTNSLNPFHHIRGHQLPHTIEKLKVEAERALRGGGLVTGAKINKEKLEQAQNAQDELARHNDEWTRTGRLTGLASTGAAGVTLSSLNLQKHNEQQIQQDQINNDIDSTKLALGSAAVAGTAYGVHRLMKRREAQNDTATR